jgi:hypothetical protein
MRRRLRGNFIVLLAAIFCIACAGELGSRFIPNYLRALGGSVLAVAAFGTPMKRTCVRFNSALVKSNL